MFRGGEVQVEYHGYLDLTSLSNSIAADKAIKVSSSYESPLSTIHQEIRRQNPVAAAAAATLGRGVNDRAFADGEFSDHLDGTVHGAWNGRAAMDSAIAGSRQFIEDDEDEATHCTCRWIRRRGAIKISDTTCATCGKRRKEGHGSKFHSLISKEVLLREPQHALALLQTTPHLRVISPASTDMQAYGYAGNRNFLQNFAILAENLSAGKANVQHSSSTKSNHLEEYKESLIREESNRRAAADLSSLLWVLAHEMPLEDYGNVESQVFASVFALIHATAKEHRMAGLAALDALLEAPSADEEKKAIKFANTLSTGLRAAHGDYEFLSAVSRALGHMASRTANVDLVESEVTRALEWLATERSDRRLAACLSLREFAIHAPTTFHSKTSQSTLGDSGSNEFLDRIFNAIRDLQPIVRVCAADALSQCLKTIVERRHLSMTGLLCQVHFSIMEGFEHKMMSKRPTWSAMQAAEASQHGSLLAVSTMLACTGDFIIPRFEEVCRAVLAFVNHPKALIRLEVIRLIPRLACRCPKVFGRRCLEVSLQFLMESASSPTPKGVGVDLRPASYSALGHMILALADDATGQVIGGSDLPTIKIVEDAMSGGCIVELISKGIIYEKLGAIFNLVKNGLQNAPKDSDCTLRPVLHCAASLVSALGDLAMPYIPDLINEMFRAGLSNDLIQCLQSIALSIPDQQEDIENRMLQEVSLCLAGVRGFYGPRSLSDGLRVVPVLPDKEAVLVLGGKSVGAQVTMNMSEKSEVVSSLVLSLQTLASFGGTIRKDNIPLNFVSLLPFVQDVASQYLNHPSSEVRRAAALTCCALLLPSEPAHDDRSTNHVGGHTGVIVEDVLDRLLRVAISDTSGLVRITVVQSLDQRYDSFLCQRHHLQDLFLLLQDESLATRAAGLRLLGRLAAINPANVLPVLRKFLYGLIVELQCKVYSGRGREEATKLLVVFLKAKSLQRLVHPVLQSLVGALPLDGAAPPRLASASLEALGELAQATGIALKPWIEDVVPHILEIMQDQSSASKQRTSLRTLGQIASSTGYVIQPYLDYPKLLMQATDILPATKRAPWSLRKEVIRTLGILGALDPDRYHSASSKARKGGAIGGAYFEETDISEILSEETSSGKIATHPGYDGTALLSIESAANASFVDVPAESTSNDENNPAYLYMHEQYAMFAQPMSKLQPSRRMTPSEEEFYPTVAIQALMRIFRDPNLSAHHGMVIQAVMFIFKSMGLGCVPFLKKVVPYVLSTVRTCVSTNLRESMLKQLAKLSLIVREHLRPYVADIFDVVEAFWSSRHLATIFGLISNIAVGVPDAFRRFVPRLIRRLVSTFDDLQAADWMESDGRSHARRSKVGTERLHLLLESVSSLKNVFDEYLHILIPALLKLADALASLAFAEDSVFSEQAWCDISVTVFRTIRTLIENHNCTSRRMTPKSKQDFGPHWTLQESSDKGLPSRVVQPIVRLMQSKATKSEVVFMSMVETLCVCAKQIGGCDWMRLYHEVVRCSILSWENELILASYSKQPVSKRDGQSHPTCLRYYDDFLEELIQPHAPSNIMNPFVDSLAHLSKNDSLNIEGNIPETYDEPSAPMNLAGVSRHKVNYRNLQRAWDVSQRASRDDWDEWMRRFSIQLLREAPAPALRSTASLAQAYQPLARELFSAAFACCWSELSEPYKANLVHALKKVFVADVSPEILQALLNLAEFMEHDPSGGLPIDISILADLALKCRAFAKALHYKEREYSLGGDNSCIESLISINRKLDLQEAALGVLKVSTMGESRKNDGSIGDELYIKFSRHQTRDMCFSVTWTTDDRVQAAGPIDIDAKEELWLAKLGSWSEALAVYESKLKRNPHDFEAILGCMRCLEASGEWRKVLELADINWFAISGDRGLKDDQPEEVVDLRSRRKAIRICSQAAWRLGRWDDLDKFAKELSSGSQQMSASGSANATGSLKPQIDFDAAFYNSVLHIHRKEWTSAAEAIDCARKAMDQRLTALMAESYSRAYPSMVTAQTLAEMEEIIEYRKIEERARVGANRHPLNRPNADEARKRLISVWRDRLAGCRMDAEVHSSILAIRSLVLNPEDEVEATLTLCELSRQAQRLKFAERVILDRLDSFSANLNGNLFGFGLPDSLKAGVSTATIPYEAVIDRVVTGDVRGIVADYGPHHEQLSRELVVEAGGLNRLHIMHLVYFAYVRHLWFTDRRNEAMKRLVLLSNVVDVVGHFERVSDTSLRVACWLELGEWKISSSAAPGQLLDEPFQADVLTTFKRATLFDSCGYRAWHAWALLNFRIAIQLRERDVASGGKTLSKTLRNHVVAAVKGFVNAIRLGTRKWSASVHQDLLNLLTCLFMHGKNQEISTIITESIGAIAIEAWLGVLPQLLARIHIKDPGIRAVLHPLLIRLGEKHPQALMYPLSVLLNSPVAERKASAESLMNSLKAHSSALVEEAQMVSSELIRVAILWLEMWHEGLEDASRLYFGEGNVSGMLDLLFPLHEMLEKGATTRQESDFLKSYGHDLSKAHSFIKEYARLTTQVGSAATIRPNEEAETAMNRAWDIYYIVFRRINKQLPSLTKLELSQCSPALSNARSLELGVPGTYRVDGSYVKIESVFSSVEVITSKQRPRKITLKGSDGKNYLFLLKGHEDLRQDERVMQLFGLVNALLVRDPQTNKHDLKIQRYAISALSHNCGVVGWVPHSDTLHSLIRDYRQARKVPLNMENREMLRIAPDFDLLTVMQKVEVFIEALRKAIGHGNDLYQILWLKSTNSEEWLERRTKFTRSQAVMSMVGYILGLGDRHPSNLMLDKVSGRILHIDFGDCFEVAMNRDKFPEKVPFRLTRMLIKAMEVSGVEGSYRSTCERTMSVLRGSRDSLVTMLEAFVYDPLISWRLVDLSTGLASGSTSERPGGAVPRVGLISDPLRDAEGALHGTIGNGLTADPIREHPDEDLVDDEDFVTFENSNDAAGAVKPKNFLMNHSVGSNRASRARSLQMYANIQNLAANLTTDSRIASIAGERSEQLSAEGSLARSRIERSMKQRELMSMLRGNDGAAHEEALNERALKVIRRVQDKLTGTDFPECQEPLDVPDQVQRLIVQATSSENLCQLFIGWCSFW